MVREYYAKSVEYEWKRLVDITPENLEFARKQIKRQKLETKVKKLVEGSITDLSMFSDDSFDAVLCLGGSLPCKRKKTERKGCFGVN